MLQVLCSNKNVARILIFLFVNGSGYGTQMHRLLQTALTPLQKALLRLENGGLIISYYEGKTRLYRFNPAYPLISELEQLLKKAYTLLPHHEKKSYYVLRRTSINQDINATQVLLAFWDKLISITRLSFNAKTKSQDEKNGWNGNGSGDVIVVKEGCNTCLFHEKGSWRDIHGAEVGFSNVFRWTFDRRAGMISLEHLRRGPEHPVFLFHLTTSGKNSLASIDAHLCEQDTYFGYIHFDHINMCLNWRVIGPKKNEEIDYYYS